MNLNRLCDFVVVLLVLSLVECGLVKRARRSAEVEELTIDRNFNLKRIRPSSIDTTSPISTPTVFRPIEASSPFEDERISEAVDNLVKNLDDQRTENGETTMSNEDILDKLVVNIDSKMALQKEELLEMVARARDRLHKQSLTSNKGPEDVEGTIEAVSGPVEAIKVPEETSLKVEGQETQVQSLEESSTALVEPLEVTESIERLTSTSSGSQKEAGALIEPKSELSSTLSGTSETNEANNGPEPSSLEASEEAKTSEGPLSSISEASSESSSSSPQISKVPVDASSTTSLEGLKVPEESFPEPLQTSTQSLEITIASVVPEESTASSIIEEKASPVVKVVPEGEGHVSPSEAPVVPEGQTTSSVPSSETSTTSEVIKRPRPSSFPDTPVSEVVPVEGPSSTSEAEVAPKASATSSSEASSAPEVPSPSTPSSEAEVVPIVSSEAPIAPEESSTPPSNPSEASTILIPPPKDGESTSEVVIQPETSSSSFKSIPLTQPQPVPSTVDPFYVQPFPSYTLPIITEIPGWTGQMPDDIHVFDPLNELGEVKIPGYRGTVEESWKTVNSLPGSNGAGNELDPVLAAYPPAHYLIPYSPFLDEKKKED